MPAPASNSCAPVLVRSGHKPDESTGAVVIGGGISGLGCARRLHDAGLPFVLVTDRLGGRMHHRPDGSVNLGATYVKADYRYVSRYVDRGMPLRLGDTYCENGGRLTTLLSPENLRHARPLGRLVRRLRELRAALRAFRREAEHTAQRNLLARHPVIARYTRQSAGDLVGELELGALHARYFTPVFEATAFLDPAKANAFFYLLTLLPIVEPTWVADFTRTYDRLTAGYADRVRLDTVVGLDRGDGGWRVRTAGGPAVAARHVVLAAPYHNVSRFYPVPRPRDLAPGSVLAVRGDRRPLYRGRGLVILHAAVTGVSLVWRQASGLDLVNCTRPDPDLSAVFERHEVVDRADWRTAVTVSGADWAPLQLEPGLYLAGDYNIGGLEDSFITGLCAANHIIRAESAAGDRPGRGARAEKSSPPVRPPDGPR